MNFNPYRDPIPRWFPSLLIALIVVGFVVYQVLT